MPLPPIEINKLIFGGQGLGHAEGRTIFAWNALPGETIDLVPWRRRKGIIEGLACKIIKSSPDRCEPQEDHYLSCSPWQILSWRLEQEWKVRIAQETFQKIGKLGPEQLGDEPLAIEGTEAQAYGYRNKMEFSAAGSSLAFFKRGSHALTPIERCDLANKVINDEAAKLMAWFGGKKIAAPTIKSLIIRGDANTGVIAAIFLRERLKLSSEPALNQALRGVKVYYSNPQSPASTPDHELLALGTDYLDVPVAGHVVRHGMLNFFQVNVPLFERTLSDIATWVQPDQALLDLYGGVGTVGVCVGGRASGVTVVDSDSGAIEYAKHNLQIGGVTGQALATTAENALSYIRGTDTIVIDPPRAGLHASIVARLLAVTPPRIIYLSCNISTQARDLALLAPKYRVRFARLYNYFPRTPHIESLLVLDRL